MNTPIRTGCKRSGKRSTPYGNRTSSPGCFAPFKSPLLSTKSTESTSCRKSTDKTMRQRLSTRMNRETLLGEIESLKQSIQEKDIQLEELDTKDAEQIEAETRIDKLHTYNELKDIAQMVMGKLECNFTIETFYSSSNCLSVFLKIKDGLKLKSREQRAKRCTRDLTSILLTNEKYVRTELNRKLIH